MQECDNRPSTNFLGCITSKDVSTVRAALDHTLLEYFKLDLPHESQNAFVRTQN